MAVDHLILDANVLFSAAYREEAPLQRLWQETPAEQKVSGVLFLLLAASALWGLLA